jgi:hypothetical protein
MALGGLYSFWRLRALALRTRSIEPVSRGRVDYEATVIIPHV